MSDYELRMIPAEDILPYRRLSSILFRAKVWNDGEDEETVIRKHREADAEQGEYFFRIGAYLDGTLYAAQEVLNYDIYFDGQPCRMSGIGAAIRDKAAISKTLEDLKQELSQGFPGTLAGYKLRDLLLTQQAVLTAMADFSEKAGGTRGSALYTDPEGQLRPGLEELFRFRPLETGANGQIQEVRLTEKGCAVTWRPVRPLPEAGDVFETVWRSYRENKNVF